VRSLEDRVRTALGAERVVFGRKLATLWDGYGEIRRVALEGVTRGQRICESAIVKHVEPRSLGAASAASQRSHRRKLRSYDVEQQFYARYASRCSVNCRVAQPLHVERTASDWLFVLEDLDAAGFARRAAARELESCLLWLAAFHATFLGVPPASLWSVGTYWHLATRPDELEALDIPSLREHAARFDECLSSARFQTLVHGDAKLDNFQVNAAGTAAAVDFQYVGGGAGIKDVAYLLSCLSPSECERSADAHLETYFRALRDALASRPDVDSDALEREWRALYPVAWADFSRFLHGWAKGAYPFDAYSRKLTALAIASVGAAAGPGLR
jgi:hypothetical protein